MMVGIFIEIQINCPCRNKNRKADDELDSFQVDDRAGGQSWKAARTDPWDFKFASMHLATQLETSCFAATIYLEENTDATVSRL